MVEKPGKTFKRVQKQREREYQPPFDPTTPYKRKYKKTMMSWHLMALSEGRWDVLVVYLLMWIALVLIVGAAVYFCALWFIDAIQPFLIQGVIQAW